MRLTATHLIESGGTFMEARLTCVRLNAELKNWRKVGRESLAFLEKGQHRKNRKILKQRGRGAPRRAFKLNLNQADRKIGWHWSITRGRMTGGLDTLIKSDREFAVDKQSNDRGGKRARRRLKQKRCSLWHLGQYYINPTAWKGEVGINYCHHLKGNMDLLSNHLPDIYSTLARHHRKHRE